jgi:hypothetical protein
LLAAIIKVTANAYEAGVVYNRYSFRNFMSQVDTLGGRTILAALTEKDLIKILTPIYSECFSKSG